MELLTLAFMSRIPGVPLRYIDGASIERERVSGGTPFISEQLNGPVKYDRWIYDQYEGIYLNSSSVKCAVWI